MQLGEEEFLRIVEATPLVSIDLIVRNEAGEVLLGKRVNRPAQGFWFVPGGRIRKNERVRDAFERISEFELGIRLKMDAARLLGVYDHIYEDNFFGKPGVNTHYVVLGFACELASGQSVTPDPQHEALDWWKVDVLRDSKEVHPNTKAYFGR